MLIFGEFGALARRAIEVVSGVSRAEASRLMRRMGCSLAGHSVVPRYQVQEWLR